MRRRGFLGALLGGAVVVAAQPVVHALNKIAPETIGQYVDYSNISEYQAIDPKLAALAEELGRRAAITHDLLYQNMFDEGCVA